MVLIIAVFTTNINNFSIGKNNYRTLDFYDVLANTFGPKSPGHFDYHNYYGEARPAKGYGRLFNKELKKIGYQMLKTNIWNNKPAIWFKTN